MLAPTSASHRARRTAPRTLRLNKPKTCVPWRCRSHVVLESSAISHMPKRGNAENHSTSCGSGLRLRSKLAGRGARNAPMLQRPCGRWMGKSGGCSKSYAVLAAPRCLATARATLPHHAPAKCGNCIAHKDLMLCLRQVAHDPNE